MKNIILLLALLLLSCSNNIESTIKPNINLSIVEHFSRLKDYEKLFLFDEKAVYINKRKTYLRSIYKKDKYGREYRCTYKLFIDNKIDHIIIHFNQKYNEEIILYKFINQKYYKLDIVNPMKYSISDLILNKNDKMKINEIVEKSNMVELQPDFKYHIYKKENCFAFAIVLKDDYNNKKLLQQVSDLNNKIIHQYKFCYDNVTKQYQNKGIIRKY